MDTLQINVKNWPPEWVNSLKNYAEELTTKFERNGPRPSAAPRRLPEWRGIASLPPDKLSREELYKDAGE